ERAVILRDCLLTRHQADEDLPPCKLSGIPKIPWKEDLSETEIRCCTIGIIHITTTYIQSAVLLFPEDLFNTLEVPEQDTIDCFHDLWHMAYRGVIAINETVFSRIIYTGKNLNLRPTREAGFQIRALQVLISESYFMGQEPYTCVGLGIKDTMMANTIRHWSQNEILSI
ncbi:hypothetical protein GcM1_025001, partial [Golovinomyces cichoracearum]